ncbi:hypothetical protein NDU88_001251 [Pleurodeles waltl]|uniref:Uncharacterized protein n=1 Tax=Pleurodeles waltl TaxID=8319 RepID=A0AAV7P630_PLEWA|nr:hypothetical protein NDU88_001251 [Pleurodeles waltl]
MRTRSPIPLNVPVLAPASAGGLHSLTGLMGAEDLTRRSRPLLTRSFRGSAPHLLLATFPKVRQCSASYSYSCRQRQRASHPWGTSMGAVGVLTTAGPLLFPSRGPQLRLVHCTAAAAILGRGSRGAVRANFGQNPLQSRGAAVPTRAGCPPITSLQFSRLPVIIMAGFMCRARFVARERRTMCAALSAPSHAPVMALYLLRQWGGCSES